MLKLIALFVTYEVGCGTVGYRLGVDRDQRWLGAGLGVVFGVLGVLVMVLTRPARRLV